MKKTVMAPNDELNKKIIAQSQNADGYAGKINALPNEKKSHKMLWTVGTLAACLMVAIGLGFYLRTPKTPWYNLLPVGDELFETYKINNNTIVLNGNGLVISYDNLDTYIEKTADLVIVGYPENTFTSDPHAYYSRENGFVTVNDDWYTLDTIRKIKVLDVLKGELDTDSINIHVSEVAIWDENGNFEIKELDSWRFIQKKNVKYIFILRESKNLYNGEKTYYSYDSVNVDGLHKASLKYIDGGFMARIIEKYRDVFEKYDRSDEVDYTLDDEKHLAISGMRYFNNEQDAFEYSDLVVVCSPKNDIADDKRVSVEGKPLETDKDVSEYFRNEVFTLRDMKVLNVIKGEKNITDVYIANQSHYYFDKHTNARQLWQSTYTPYEDPIVKKDSVYLYYLKKDEVLGQNVYRVSGRQCVVNIDGTDKIGGLYRYTAKRVYEIYVRNMDVIKEYMK